MFCSFLFICHTLTVEHPRKEDIISDRIFLNPLRFFFPKFSFFNISIGTVLVPYFIGLFDKNEMLFENLRTFTVRYRTLIFYDFLTVCQCLFKKKTFFLRKIKQIVGMLGITRIFSGTNSIQSRD